jgi:hypothetical protein
LVGEKNENYIRKILFRYFRRVSRMANRYNGLNAVIFTLSTFWWGAAMLQMGLLKRLNRNFRRS